MSCRLDDGLVATYHCPKHGETVEVRCQCCGAVVHIIREPDSRRFERVQQVVRQVFQLHVSPAAIDFQI